MQNFAQKNLLCEKEDTWQKRLDSEPWPGRTDDSVKAFRQRSHFGIKKTCPSEKRCSCYSRVKRKSLLFAQCWEHLNYFLFFVCIIKAGLGWPSSNYCSRSSGFTQLEQCLQGLQSWAVLRTGWVGWEQDAQSVLTPHSRAVCSSALTPSFAPSSP